MATEKIINTRIQLKYDTLANWNANSSLILRKGEVGICAIPTNSSHLQTTPPAIMFKVGDGVVDAQGAVTGTQFKDLPWASALAADVYAWAKKAVPEVTDFGDIIAAAREGLISADSVVKTLNGLKGDVTIAPADDETHITVSKSGQTITFALNLSAAESAALSSGITSTKVTKYDGYDERITAAESTADAAQTTANSKYSKPTGGIPKTDLAEAIQTSLDKADSALQSQTIATGSTNGTIAVAGKDVAVKGLAALAYKASLGKADVGLDNVENKGLDTTVTASSGNYITSGAVRTAIDNAISGVTQFDIVKYESFDKLPATGKKGVIYIIAHAHSDSNDSYDEYIWNTALTTPAYEKIGNTDVNLTNYVNGISGTANNGVVTNITKDGNTITVTSKSLETADPTTEAGNSIAFIKSVSQAADGKITAHKQNVPSATQTAAGLMTAADKKKLDGIAEGANKYVLPIATDSALGGVKAGVTNGKVYGVDVAADGAMTVSVPWENTQNANTWRNITLDGTAYKGTDIDTGALDLRHGDNVSLSIDETTKGVVISAKDEKTTLAGHYTPAADSTSQLSVDAAGGSAATWNTTQLVTGVNLQRDAKGHVVGVTVDSVKMPANPNTDNNTWRQINVKGTQFKGTGTGTGIVNYVEGNNVTLTTSGNDITISAKDTITTVEKDGVGLKVTKTDNNYKVGIDDDVVFVFNCGSATELVD